MKLSLAWIFDHIQASWKDYDIAELVEKFNGTTAEIEEYRKVDIDLRNFTLIRITETDSEIMGMSDELNQEISLPQREDIHEGQIYLIKKNKDAWDWAKLPDLGGTKDRLLAPISCNQKEFAGAWKDSFEVEDYIIEIDNTSITHRPDLWGHRGVAREVAAIIDKPFLPDEYFLADYPVRDYEDFASSTSDNPFSFEIEAENICKRFAGVYFSEISHAASWLDMASRLARIDSKPIDAIVDTTNYVMFDTSQPLHGFDADAIEEKKIIPRMAKNKESLILLDDEEISLTNQDCVISSGKEPLALAGIMGGKKSGITSKTTSMLLESANFDAVSIRKTAQRFKLRTDASMRFEKSLDPNQNIAGILRFLKILQEKEMPFQVSSEIVSLGQKVLPKEIIISHKKIETMLGASIESSFIEKILQRLGFEVAPYEEHQEQWYKIFVPTFRSTKDVLLPEDIVEEIGRFFGFENIPQELPAMQMSPSDETALYRERKIKQCMATTMSAHEVMNYSLYDKEFLSVLGWQPEEAVSIQNPVSEFATQLVTSLIPGLLQNIYTNSADYSSLRFFESGRIWLKESSVHELKSVSGIIYEQKESVDFYKIKELLQKLFRMLHLSVEWKSADTKYLENNAPWFHPYQTAQLLCQDELLGHAGKVNPVFMHRIGGGDAFIFELNGDFLFTFEQEELKYEPSSKYPGSWRDISMLIPIALTVNDIIDVVKNIDGRIQNVQLIDFFQKDEWKDQRSVTIRIDIQDYEKTLQQKEIDAIFEAISQALQKEGAQIR